MNLLQLYLYSELIKVDSLNKAQYTHIENIILKTLYEIHKYHIYHTSDYQIKYFNTGLCKQTDITTYLYSWRSDEENPLLVCISDNNDKV